ncbi:MAG: 5-(carboxyamino)imidazole ribonucleotide mutase [Prevotellaceae bacterium]|jgi:5-(carboxyamino)imidazole ribonucleotide mutase|nr:5-(carboxyamino)imidazole ribonucleotide mutase [Prevotellaceae bacterium]
MEAKVSIVMGSVSDLKIMEGAAQFLNEMNVPFEINALSAHRVPLQVAEYADNLESRGVKVVIAGAGGAAHLPGVIAAVTPIPVIGVPIKSSNSIDGWDSILSILQMPAGIPVATVALDGARNAGILAVQILAVGNEELMCKFKQFKSDLAQKVLKANEELKNVKYEFKIDK